MTERTTFLGYMAKITAEEDARTHNIEINNKALYNADAYETNEARALSMDYPSHKRRLLVRSYTYLRHRELTHEEDFKAEKETLVPQMLTVDIQAVEDGLAQVDGWWVN